jgi:hypothetical protein
VCYANAGTIFYGDNPPYTTWTASDVCSGANSGYIIYWVNGNWWRADLDYWTCFQMRAYYGRSVEVAEFHIN